MKQSVSFDPLALMLDAAMEGELALVRTTASQVSCKGFRAVVVVAQCSR